MHSPRLPQGNRGPGTTTPHHPRSGAVLDQLIRSLEGEYRLQLRVRDHLTKSRSPSTHNTADRPLEEKVYALVQQLFYSSLPTLTNALDEFRREAPRLAEQQRLSVLHGILRSTSPVSRAGTPLSSQRRARADRPRDVPPKTIKSPQPLGLPSRNGNIFRNHDEPADVRAMPAEPEAGSDTEEDEFVTPPSPTTSSISAQRRVQASPRIPYGPVGRKRPSESLNDSGKSPKLTKSAKGKQPADKSSSPQPSKPPSPICFKKPSLQVARSLPVDSFISSTTTSFNANASFNSMWSQQTQPGTTNTTFTTDPGDGDGDGDGDGEGGVRYPHLTRTSSTTIGSLDDKDLSNATARLEKEFSKPENEPFQKSQDMTRESSSTFGSIDEDAMLAQEEYPGRQSLASHSAHITQNSKSQNSKLRLTSSPDKSTLQPTSPFTKTMNSQAPISYHIRDIPVQNLFVEELPRELMAFPYFILFIYCRIATIKRGTSITELMRNVKISQIASDTQFDETMKKTHEKFKLSSAHSWKTILEASKQRFEGFTFRGQILLNNRGPVFSLRLMPIQADRSCRFQRKFGADRFLYLSVPPLDAQSSSRFNAKEMGQVRERWADWFNREHSFLGRKWRAFHVEPIKKKLNKRRSDTAYDKRMVLFATEGYDITEPCSIGDMLDWFFPFSINREQSFCKAFARIDLGLSRTTPTLVFKPSQVKYVDDIKPDGTLEDEQFNDLNLEWKEINMPESMNDGCSIMSVGAAQQIWKVYKEKTGTTDPIPSAFQGRIAGAKGLWIISAETYTKDPYHLDIWISINKSQRKFRPKVEDMDDQTFDPLRLTFEVSNYSSRAFASDLHISFIPILVDRGVPEGTMARFMTETLDLERCQLLQMLHDSARINDWVHKNGSKSRESEVQWQASLPNSLEEKIRFLIESGFSTKTPFLAKCLERFIMAYQLFRQSKLRTPLGKSTYLYGVADPYGVLQPGEVHVQFSTSFIDEATDEKFRCLQDIDLLVARQPACRRSDIQKVRTVVHPKLCHLEDVVVFPSRGQYPLAGKLQGGDYDGDVFWLCWDPILVEPFKNAPAPTGTPDPMQYGIKTEKRKLYHIMNLDKGDLSDVDNLLREALAFRVAPSMLGIVTVFLEKQAYKENKIFSHTLDRLCDMHDLLVDAPKSGYTFNKTDFRNYLRKTLNIYREPDIPAYKQAMEECLDAKETGTTSQKLITKEYGHQKNQILDSLYFEVVRAHDKKTMDLLKEKFSKAFEFDETLEYPLKCLEKTSVIDQELLELREKLEPIKRDWNSITHGQMSSEQFKKLLDKCYGEFRAIMPVNIDDPQIKPLVKPYLQPESCIWEFIKASVLYSTYRQPEKATFVFYMAGKELCKLKSGSFPNSRAVVPHIHANTKPKPIKAPIQLEDDASDDEFATVMEETTLDVL